MAGVIHLRGVASTTRQLVVTVVLTLFLAGSIVAVTKWAVDMTSSRTWTVKTQQWAPIIGYLTLSVTVVSENEVMVNLTFSGAAYASYPGYNWTLWVSKGLVTYVNETSLLEGLELVEGALKVNGLSPFPSNSLSFQTKLRVIADGEWLIYGHFSATDNPAPGENYGWYVGTSTGGIKITVINGSIVRVEEAPYPTSPSTQQPSNQTEQPYNPPIHPSNP